MRREKTAPTHRAPEHSTVCTSSTSRVSSSQQTEQMRARRGCCQVGRAGTVPWAGRRGRNTRHAPPPQYRHTAAHKQPGRSRADARSQHGHTGHDELAPNECPGAAQFTAGAAADIERHNYTQWARGAAMGLCRWVLSLAHHRQGFRPLLFFLNKL